MAKFVNDDGTITMSSPTQPPQLSTSQWQLTFVLAPKRSINDAPIRPLSRAYNRQREIYVSGQRLVLEEWQTEAEYIMSVLKAN